MVSEFVVVVAFQLLIVTFQGSVTVKDGAVDIKAILTRIENPLSRVEGREFTVSQSKKFGCTVVSIAICLDTRARVDTRA